MLNKVMFTYNKKTVYREYKNCVNSQCTNQISIRMIGDQNSSEFGLPVPSDRRKLACCRECHRIWQKSISWEQRVGEEFATEFRKKMSELSSTNNPSTFPGVAEKISKGLKKYLEKNPEARLGENNGFFGKKHATDLKEQWAETKKGKWAYTLEQKEKQSTNTPKRENHPNWLGGISNGDYGLEFNQLLKAQIKKSYNSTCQICKNVTTELDIHHIDYNKQNNLLENLIPLCKVCHGKTNYNRERWKNFLTDRK